MSFSHPRGCPAIFGEANRGPTKHYLMSAEGGRRRILLVGSMPYEDEASDMARVCKLAGDRLIALPNGEIGERSDQYPNGDRSQWVAGLAGRLSEEPSLFDVVDPGTMNEPGFPVDFGTRPSGRVPKSVPQNSVNGSSLATTPSLPQLDTL